MVSLLFSLVLVLLSFIVAHSWRLWPWQQITAHILFQPLHDQRCDIGVPSYSDNTFDSWELRTTDFVQNHYQASPYVANGYFGQRLPAEGVGYWIYVGADGRYDQNSWPLDQPRATFGTVAGFWNLQARVKHVLLPDNLKKGGESVISGIPGWTGLALVTGDGHGYVPGVDKATVKSFYQSLSIRNGIVHTNITWSPSSDHPAQYQLNYTVLAHRTRPNVGIVRLDLEATDDVNCTVIDILDGAGAVRAHFGDKAVELEDNIIWTSVKPWGIENVTAYVFSTVQYQGYDRQTEEKVQSSRRDATLSPWVSRNLSTVAQSWDLLLKKHQPVTIYKVVGISSSDAFPNRTFSTAKYSALAAKSTGWDELIQEHILAWEKVWESAGIDIPGDQELQTSVRASLFHLLTNLRSPEKDRGATDNSITVGGLSSDSYAGLVFWDADTWVYPSVLALHPDYATTINNYRARLLPQAVENAKSHGYSGALFPWTSGRFGNCTGTGVCKDYQYHLNTDIALAQWQYYQHTGNTSWLGERGWPLIKNAADMFAAYAVYNGTTDEYETILLGEPDEFAYFKNNGAYTNAGIKRLLGDIAPTAARILNQSTPQNWSDIANKIRIPVAPNNITLEFDGMQGDWEVKQASVALMNYPLDYRISEEHARNDIEYYSVVNTRDGPAMTWSIYAIAEAQLQQSGCASYTYLLRSAEPYLRLPFYQFSETAIDTPEDDNDSNPAFPFGLHPAFPFLTGAGGFLQVFTHGLTGMRSHHDYLYLDPTLPPQIPQGVTVKGIKWQEASFDISIQLDTTTITRRRLLVSADDIPALLRIGKHNSGHGLYTLRAGDSLTIPTRQPDTKPFFYDGKPNLAQCKPVTTPPNQRWVFGRYPVSIVDGSNATVWQPLTPESATVTIDLGRPTNISGFKINWGSSPARSFVIHGRLLDSEDTVAVLYEANDVGISSPFNPEELLEVKIRDGNMTTALLDKTFYTREVSLTIEGTQGEEQELGATVAELVVF